MRKRNGKKLLCSLVLTVSLSSTMYTPVFTVQAKPDGPILINEIESNDTAEGNDWVEIINIGSEAVDISGWFIVDDKGLEELTESKTTPLKEGTILKAGEVYVLEQETDFTFGLGREDTVTLYNSDKNAVDSYSYNGHANGTYSRDTKTLEFVDQEPTKGKTNETESVQAMGGKLVINEINSAPDDWIEFMNIGDENLDISGYEIRDNSDDHRWKFAEGTVAVSGGFVTVKAGESDGTDGLMYDDTSKEYKAGKFDIGIGSGDSIRLYDKAGNLIDTYSWTEHASYDGQDALASYGRYPDGTGSFVLTKETPGRENDWYAPQLVINEVESDDGDNPDWVEVYNAGTTDIDLSGYYLLDNDEVKHKTMVTPVADGTILKPGAFYVFEGGDNGRDFQFSLGKKDCATIYNKDGAVVAAYSWEKHAGGVYARIPDGTGELADFSVSTKGKANRVTNPVVINEVQSNDPKGGEDWIELANPTAEEIDISGLIIKDNSEKDSYTIPEGTKIEANGFLILKGKTDFQFGLGKGDSVRIFETIDGREQLIQSTVWPEGTHTSPTWGLYPDVNGSEYRNTKEETPGAANKFADILEVQPWKGSSEVKASSLSFLEDSSGLDFFHGQLYAVDNGTATFWILDAAADGTLSFAEGFENGKRVVFQKDAENPKAAGPDTEGITVDGSGYVYLAAERDNSAKGVNFNVILKANPNEPGDRIVAMQEWNITDLLPKVAANMGIESVEWVANADVENTLYDRNTKAAFQSADYPDAVAGGVFFVALEDNGHVYAFVLHSDSTATLIADIDSKIGGAMALDYDTYEKILRVASDNGYNNKMAQITFNGTEQPDIEHFAAPSGLDTTKNYEGFAVADASYTVNGERLVYRFQDGVKEGSLCIGSIACSYEKVDEEEDVNGNEEDNEEEESGEASDFVSSVKPETASSAADTAAGDGGLTGVWKQNGNGWWYEFEDKSYPVNKWSRIGGQWFFFDAAGYMSQGWKMIDSKWYYLNPVNGDMAEGWKFLGGKWYYLNPVSGDMAEGWKLVGGKWYYLKRGSGECLMNTMTPDGYKVDASGAWIK